MNEKRKKHLSKFLSLILRHKPETVGLKLEENGWVEVETLLKACSDKGNPFTLEELVEVIETNDKKRFSFDESKTRIRANQGHSLIIKIDFEEKRPPKILYHGTAEKNIKIIFKQGLQKMRRHHVHLSADTETARNVGIRYGRPVIFQIDTEKMMAAGFKFFVSANGVWLVNEVPPKFLKVL